MGSWGKIFDDPMVAAAMLDRLLHRSVVFNIDGDSYRMRSHRARSERLRSRPGPRDKRRCHHVASSPDIPHRGLTWGIPMSDSGEVR